MSLFPYNPKTLLESYARGLFPTLNIHGEFILFKPEHRALLPLDGIKVCNGLKSALNKQLFQVKFDTAFDRVVEACIRPNDNWITPELARVYSALFRQGWAHSVECYNREGLLAGGLYGIAIGAAFFIESRFSVQSQASKVAVDALIKHCRAMGFKLIDVQMMSDHLAELGGYQVSDDRFQLELFDALHQKTEWGLSVEELRKKVFPPQLEYEGVMIRGLVEDDAHDLLKMNQDPRYYKYTFVTPIETLADAQNHIKSAISERYPNGIPDPLGICLKQNPTQLIGTIGGFTPFPGLPQMEFAVDLDPNFWGKGLATKACRLLIDYLFSEYPVRRLQGRQSVDNIAVHKLFERLGFTFEGILREVMYFNGRTWDMRYVSLTYDDWLQQKNGRRSLQGAQSFTQECTASF